MTMLNTVENLGVKVGTLVAGQLVMEQVGVEQMLLDNGVENPLIRGAIKNAYLVGTEMVSEFALKEVRGEAPRSLFRDISVDALTAFVATTATDYLLTEVVLRQVPALSNFALQSSFNRAVLRSAFYVASQELASIAVKGMLGNM